MSTPAEECQESHNANDVCPPPTTTTNPPPTTVTSAPATTTTTKPTPVVTVPPTVPPATPSLPVTGGGIGTEAVLVLGLVMVASGAIQQLRNRARRMA